MILTAKQLAERRRVQNDGPSFAEPVAEAVRISSEKNPRSRIRDVETPPDPKTWVFVHPDSAESDPVRSKFIVDLPSGEREILRPDMGRYTTQNPEVRDALKAQGFLLVNDVPLVQNEPRWDKDLARLKEQS